MRRSLIAILLTVLPLALPRSKDQHFGCRIGPRYDLPVRKVVLYKNGVGYFEHAGTVNGDQRVAIDFTSSQLNDVLQSLTALDSKGGKVSAVSYNSTTPIEQQLNSLSLGLKDSPDTLDVYHAIRGQRVEVTGTGAPLLGRLVNIEHRKETDKNGATSEDHYFLIVATDTGALRTAEITDAVSVRMVDPHSRSSSLPTSKSLARRRTYKAATSRSTTAARASASCRSATSAKCPSGNPPTASSSRAIPTAAPRCRVGQWSTTPWEPTGTTCSSRSSPERRKASSSRFRSRSTSTG